LSGKLTITDLGATLVVEIVSGMVSAAPVSDWLVIVVENWGGGAGVYHQGRDGGTRTGWTYMETASSIILQRSKISKY